MNTLCFWATNKQVFLYTTDDCTLTLALLIDLQLLEMLMNNIGEPIHKQVTEAGLLPILVKIVKKKVSYVLHVRTWYYIFVVSNSYAFSPSPSSQICRYERGYFFC